MKKIKYFLFPILLVIGILLFTGCGTSNSETKSLDEQIVGEWTYTNGLAELEFNSEGKAAAIIPEGSGTETKQFSYEIEDSQLTLRDPDSDVIALIADIEINEKDGKEYLTLANLHDGEGNTMNPTTADFEKLGDSTEAIE